MLDVCMQGVPKVRAQLLALQIRVNQQQLPVAQEWAFPQSCPWHREAVAPVRGALLRTFTPSCQGLLDLCSILSYLPSRCILILLVLDYLAYQDLYQNSFLVQISLEPMIVPCTGLIMELQQLQPFNIKMKVSAAFSKHILVCSMLCSFDCSTLFAVHSHLGLAWKETCLCLSWCVLMTGWFGVSSTWSHVCALLEFMVSTSSFNGRLALFWRHSSPMWTYTQFLMTRQWVGSYDSVAMRANMQIWLNILLWGIATIAEFLTHDCHCSPSEHLGGPFVSWKVD